MLLNTFLMAGMFFASFGLGMTATRFISHSSARIAGESGNCGSHGAPWGANSGQPRAVTACWIVPLLAEVALSSRSLAP